MYGYIYLTENLINHKKYIGQHKASEFDLKYLGSGLRLSNAINKYGRENFKSTILCTCESEDELNEKEAEYIIKYNAVASSDYYNIAAGGEAFNRGLIFVYNAELDDVTMIDKSNFEHYANMGYVRGIKPHTEEQIEHYKQGKKDLIPITDGSKTIYIHKDKLSAYEERGYRKGRHKATRPNQKAEARKWMNKDGKSIMVKGCDVQQYLNDGYSLGRVKFSHFNRVQPPHNKGKKRIKVGEHYTYV